MAALVSKHSYAQDTIHWREDYKLKWQDFKGLPDTTSEYKAITVADVKYILSYDNSSFKVKVSCAFDKTESWTVSYDSIGLAHEQGHFDIAEIFARKLRKYFLAYVFNPQTIKQNFSKLFSTIKEERRKYNVLYDQQTDFSRNKEKQFTWNRIIKGELNKLKAFKE